MEVGVRRAGNPRSFTSAALAGPLVYFGTHAGFLHALDAKTGAPAWSLRTDGSKRDPMDVVNDDGSLNRAAFAPVFGDFQDMYDAPARPPARLPCRPVPSFVPRPRVFVPFPARGHAALPYARRGL